MAQRNQQQPLRPTLPLQSRIVLRRGSIMRADWADSGDTMLLNIAAATRAADAFLARSRTMTAESYRQLLMRICSILAANDASSSYTDGPSTSLQRLQERSSWLANVNPNPHEVSRWLQNLQDAVDSRILELKAQINHQRMSLARELCVTREALHTARREREEAEENAHRMQMYVTSLEKLLERKQEKQGGKTGPYKEEVRKLCVQVEELEEQLDLMYQNIACKHRASTVAEDNVLQKRQARHFIQQVQCKVQLFQDKVQKMQDDLAHASSYLKAMCTDTRQDGQDNVQMQIYVNAARWSARRLVEQFLETPIAKSSDVTQLTRLMDVDDNDLVLDRVLLTIANIMKPQ